MRVALLLPAPGIPVQGPTGASAHVRGLLDGFAGIADTRLYAARRSDHRGVFGPPVPARVAGVPPRLGRAPEHVEIAAARRVARLVVEDALREGAPDLVVERHALFSDAGWRVHDRLGVPWVLEVDAPAHLERRRFERAPLRALAERWERDVLLAAPVVVAVSRWLARWLREEVGCRDVRWVPNGVLPVEGSRARGRALLGVGEDERLVGFVGSFKPWHGVERLPRIARAAGARLVLVGHLPADARRAFPHDAIATGFLDPQPLADVLAALDVGVAPWPAGAPPWFCPLKVLDLRAQGTPVVATEVGDAAVLVEDGGTVVPADDDDAIVDAVRAWMGRRCARRVRSWRTVARQLLAVAGLQAQR